MEFVGQLHQRFLCFLRFRTAIKIYPAKVICKLRRQTKIGLYVKTPTPQREARKIKIGSPKIGSPKIGSPKIDSQKIGSPKIGFLKISSPKIGSRKRLNFQYYLTSKSIFNNHP